MWIGSGGEGGGIPVMNYIGRPKRGTFSRVEDEKVVISRAEV